MEELIEAVRRRDALWGRVLSLLGIKKEKYPICLTCYSVMKLERDYETECRYYCPVCKLYKGLVEVQGFDVVANRIRAIAREHNIKPVY